MPFIGSTNQKATNTNAQDDARVLSGKSSRYTEKGSFQVGDKATYTEAGGFNLGKGASVHLAPEFGSAQIGGNVTFGEVGASKTFADTVKALNEQNSSAISTLLSGLNPANAADATPADALPDTSEPKPVKPLVKWGVLALLLGGGWLLLRKR